MGRAPCCDRGNVKKGPWSPEEDLVLKDYLEKHGNSAGSWTDLPQKAGLNRCGKSCRLRWLNYLRPDIKRGNYTEEEDHIIYSLYKNIGSRWSTIASNLEGRTDNDVKNYWHTKLKKKIFTGEVNLNNVIDNPKPSSPSPGVLNHSSTTRPLAIDTSSSRDVGPLNPIQFSSPGVPALSSDRLPLDYNSWWVGNGIGDDYGCFTEYATLGFPFDVLPSGVMGPNNVANYSAPDSCMFNTSDAKPQGEAPQRYKLKREEE